MNMNQLKSDGVSNSLKSRLSDLLSQRWSSHLPVQDKLAALVDSVKEVANQVLASVTRKAADWFLENEHDLKPGGTTCSEHGCHQDQSQIRPGT